MCVSRSDAKSERWLIDGVACNMYVDIWRHITSKKARFVKPVTEKEYRAN
jgi:hypothetical protein